MCYATRDKLIIDDIIIDNIADFDTLTFVGAIYTYDTRQRKYGYKSYFKDKNSVYSYYEKSQEMIKENYNPKTFDEEAMWKLRVRRSGD